MQTNQENTAQKNPFMTWEGEREQPQARTMQTNTGEVIEYSPALYARITFMRMVSLGGAAQWAGGRSTKHKLEIALDDQKVLTFYGTYNEMNSVFDRIMYEKKGQHFVDLTDLPLSDNRWAVSPDYIVDVISAGAVGTQSKSETWLKVRYPDSADTTISIPRKGHGFESFCYGGHAMARQVRQALEATGWKQDRVRHGKVAQQVV